MVEKDLNIKFKIMINFRLIHLKLFQLLFMQKILFQVPKSLVSSEIVDASPVGDASVIKPGSNVGTNEHILIGAMVGGTLLLFIVASAIFFYLRRRICPVDGKVQPVSVMQHYS